MGRTIDLDLAVNALQQEMKLHPCGSGEWFVLSSCLGKLVDLPSAQPDGISLEWINKHLEWLDNCDNDFAQLAKVSIRAMVDLWKKDRT